MSASQQTAIALLTAHQAGDNELVADMIAALSRDDAQMTLVCMTQVVTAANQVLADVLHKPDLPDILLRNLGATVARLNP